MGTRDNRPTRNFYTCIKVPSKSVCREGDSGIPNDEEDCDLDAYGMKAGRVVGSRLPDGRTIGKWRMVPFANYHSVVRPSPSIATAFAMHRIEYCLHKGSSTTDKALGLTSRT